MSDVPIEPTEVLTAEEFEALRQRRAAQRAKAAPQPPSEKGVFVTRSSLGGLLGGLVAKAIGVDPRVGRGLGILTARATDPEVQAQVREQYEKAKKGGQEAFDGLLNALRRGRAK